MRISIKKMEVVVPHPSQQSQATQTAREFELELERVSKVKSESLPRRRGGSAERKRIG